MKKSDIIRNKDWYLIKVLAEGNNAKTRDVWKKKYKRFDREHKNKFWIWFYFHLEKLLNKKKIKESPERKEKKKRDLEEYRRLRKQRPKQLFNKKFVKSNDKKNKKVLKKVNRPSSILRLINSKENENLEFKSTLSWNLRANLKDKRIEGEVIECLAGFSNKEGGTLVIGVDDDHKILGLDNDFRLANLKDEDKFELHLRNLLRSRLNIENEYLARKVRVSFETIEQKDICIIKIKKGNKPIFTKEEKFFLRDGNTTIEIKPSEVHKYIKERF